MALRFRPLPPALLLSALLLAGAASAPAARGEGGGGPSPHPPPPPSVQQAQGGIPVSLELVLAIDASSSINRNEFGLQMQGLAEAFRDPQVHQALAVGGTPGVAVMLLQWADSRHQSISVPWQVVFTPAEAEAFADAIDATPRFVVGGGTAIGSAITFATRLLLTNDYVGGRMVIDVSGDGRANQGEIPVRARDAAVAAGIVINGLAILNEDPALNVYYRQYVIGGPGAFVMTARDFTDYRDAIVEKLIREISAAPMALGPAPLPDPTALQTAERRAGGPPRPLID